MTLWGGLPDNSSATANDMTNERTRNDEAQDTPGRPTPSASRQQTHKDQGTQTGAAAIDANSNATAKPERKEEERQTR